MKIYDSAGGELADIEVSDKQRGLLDDGQEVSVIFHTPQTMRGLLQPATGAFSLRQVDGKAVTAHVNDLQRYATMQAAIKRIREKA